MTGPGRSEDWNPEAYSRFRGLRLRPALDLLAQVPHDLPAGAIVDLGCGAGAIGPALAARFPGRDRCGLDLSANMLAQAEETGAYSHLTHCDIADWGPALPPALIYSNATLNWLPDHGALLPHLAATLCPGGTLAVQVPDQQDAPSHQLLRSVSARMFPDVFDWRDWAPEVLPPETLAEVLTPLGELDLWQAVYYQRLASVATGHPVRHFTQSTVARPVLARLGAGQQAEFLAAYDAALLDAYPVAADGSVLFPFRRLFFVLSNVRSVP